MRQLKITKQVTNRETASLDKYLQEIGKVLHQILAGIKNPDLSHLPKHVAEFINRELEK